MGWRKDKKSPLVHEMTEVETGCNCKRKEHARLELPITDHLLQSN